MTAHAFPADPTLESLRVQRGAYAASRGEAAVIYDKLRDELAVAKQRLSDQEEMLIPADDLDATAIAWCDLHDRITRGCG
jgi:hypothetical protein